jgi:hypothetical protein
MIEIFGSQQMGILLATLPSQPRTCSPSSTLLEAKFGRGTRRAWYVLSRQSRSQPSSRLSAGGSSTLNLLRALTLSQTHDRKATTKRSSPERSWRYSPGALFKRRSLLPQSMACLRTVHCSRIATCCQSNSRQLHHVHGEIISTASVVWVHLWWFECV